MGLGDFYTSCYLGCLLSVLLSTAVALLCLPNRWAAGYLACLWATLLWPLDKPTSAFGRHFCKLSIEAAIKRHKLQVHYEDQESLKPGRPYVVGHEPHSALPMILHTVLSRASNIRPPAFKNPIILATSIGFWVPLERHLWWWIGTRPASRQVMHKQLAEGGTVVLIPGGVQECSFMEPGKEVAFLRSRKGFVRIALQHGAPLVPVFSFGQTNMYKWVRFGPPFLSSATMHKISRTIGFLPMWVYGKWGTLLTFEVPVHMVIGKAIEVPKVENPSQEQIDVYLQRFINALDRLFHEYKDRAGHGKTRLEIL